MEDNINEDEITEGEIKLSHLISIDSFYSISQYNEALHALKNNGIQYEEWVVSRNPFHFYLDLKGKKPIMLNYEVIDRNDWIKAVSKVQPLVGNDEVVLYRRGERVSDIKLFINNDVFAKALKAPNTIVFHYQNREQLLNLSKTYGTIYPIGRYLSGAKRLAICFDPLIKNVIIPKDIELEMGKHKLGELEIQINYKVLRNKDKIIKWIKTPKFNNGKYIPTVPASPLKI